MIALLVLALTGVTPASPARLDAAAADTARRAIEKDRADTQEWLKRSPSSYLATVARRDFGSRATLSVGSATGNDVRLDDAAVLPHHLRVSVVGDSFHLVGVDPNARFGVQKSELHEATLGPSSIAIGRFTLRLSHQRFPALIVFDPRSPRFKEYKGLRYFPVDLAYYFVLPLTRDPAPDTVVIQSTRGNRRRALRVGWFDFRLGGRACRLEAHRLLEPGIGENDFGIFFRDATCGKESYPMGRYVDAHPRPDGLFVLDFNSAYNPACAYSLHYNCPIPSHANTLPMAIRAGEMDSHYLKYSSR